MLEIHCIWEESHSNYGARKIWKQLRRESFDIARCTVERFGAYRACDAAPDAKPQSLMIRHIASPQTNGICERFHKTILQEFYQVTFRKKIYRSIEELQADLDR